VKCQSCLSCFRVIVLEWFKVNARKGLSNQFFALAPKRLSEGWIQSIAAYSCAEDERVS
jgi:hypothetical protein